MPKRNPTPQGARRQKRDGRDWTPCPGAHSILRSQVAVKPSRFVSELDASVVSLQRAYDSSLGNPVGTLIRVSTSQLIVGFGGEAYTLATEIGRP